MNRPAPLTGVALERLVVIGAGAVGGTLSALLHASGFPVVVVARGEHGRAIQRDGLQLTTAETTVRAAVRCVESIDQVEFTPGDVAVVATKLNDAQYALEALLAHAGRQVPVLCATNGVHCERWAARRFDTVVSTLVWTPALHLEPGHVVVYAKVCPAVFDCGCFVDGDHGLAHSDAVLQLSQNLCQRFAAAGFAARARADMQRFKRAKWLVNLGNTSQALVQDDWQRCAEAAMAEGRAVLAASGLDRVRTKELLDRCAVVIDAPVAGQTRPGGSTWQSLQRGKALESPWLEGAIAELGASLGVPTPINRFLAEVGQQPRPLTAGEVLAQA